MASFSFLFQKLKTKYFKNTVLISLVRFQDAENGKLICVRPTRQWVSRNTYELGIQTLERGTVRLSVP